jgi:4-amino-4-deoxy-L-arabinose transferase-like glycosyltransferase
MWQNGNLLVPHLNGIPYSHKPPLLFWLILAGWELFGVNEWWPRLLPPLFGLGCLFLTAIFARRLWPDKNDITFTAPYILLGCILWTLFTTLVMYDMLVVFFVLLGLLCLHRLGSGKGSFLLWIVLGLSLGMGILSKGPVVLLPVAMVAVSAPWWGKNSSIKDHIKFYAGVEIGRASCRERVY